MGNHLLSSRIWRLAWPMILSNLSVPLLGMVDTAVVGHWARADDMAAVALGAMAFDIIFWGFGFLRMSTTALAAQEQDHPYIFYQSAFIALMIALLLLIAAPFLKDLLLMLIHSKPQVEAKLAGYFDIRIYAALPTLMNYVIFGFYFGRQNTATPLMLLMFINGLAMILDLVLVRHFHLTAEGVAAANLIAQSLGMMAGLGFIYLQFLKQHGFPDVKAIFAREKLKKLFGLNRDIFIRTLVLVTTTAFFTRQSASLGVIVVAANSLLMQFQLMTSYALDGFAIAAEGLIGEAVGQKNDRAFRQALLDCGRCSLVIALLFTLLYAVFGQPFIHLLTSIKPVQQEARVFLPWVIALPLLSAPGFLLDGVFIGAAWSKSLRNTMLAASLLVFFPLWYLTQGIGNHGLWLAYSAFMLARGAGLAFSLIKTCLR